MGLRMTVSYSFFQNSEIANSSHRNSMANTKSLSRDERKKSKRAARKKAPAKAKRTVPRGSAKRKVKKMVRGTAKR